MADFLDGLRAGAAASAFPATASSASPDFTLPSRCSATAIGVAYISADSLDDLWFAQGLVTAGERLFQVDLALKQANGRLSELFGDLTLDDDRFTRTIGINRAGVAIAAGWDDTSRAMIARFREGIRAWIDAMPAPPVEYVLLDASPELPDDDASWAACWAMFSWGLSGNWDLELLRVHLAAELGAEAAGRLLPPLSGHPTAPAAGRLAGDLLQELPSPAARPGLERVGDRRCQDGFRQAPARQRSPPARPAAGRLARAPPPCPRLRGPRRRGAVRTRHRARHHGPPRLGRDQRRRRRPGPLPRAPERGPARPPLYEDAWEPLIEHHEEIRVRGSDEPIVHEVRATRHGPLLESYLTGRLRPTKRPLDASYALRWVGAEHSIRPSALIDVANVESFEEFREAARALECPGQNLVYADVDGTIGYQCTGLHPIRAAGDGTVPGTRVDGRARVAGLRAVRGAPLRGRSRPGVSRDGERSDPCRRLPAPDRTRLPFARSRREDHRAARGTERSHGGHVPGDPVRHGVARGADPAPQDLPGRRAGPRALRGLGPRPRRGLTGRRAVGSLRGRARAPRRRRRRGPRRRVPDRSRAVPLPRAPRAPP